MSRLKREPATRNPAPLAHLNIVKTNHYIGGPHPTYDGQDVEDWIADGQPANSAVATYINDSVEDWAAEVENHLANNEPVILWKNAGAHDTTPIPSGVGFRSEGHGYIVRDIVLSGATPTQITLRNPYGFDEVFTDMVRVYYYFSRGVVVSNLYGYPY